MQLDRTQLQEGIREEMREEARVAFELNIRLNEEFGAGAAGASKL